MSELKPRIKENGIDYILVGDYYIPDFEVAGGTQPIRKVRTDAPGIFKRSLPSQITHIDPDRNVWSVICRPERTGTETVQHHHGADESCRGRDRGIEAYPSNGMGAALQ